MAILSKIKAGVNLARQDFGRSVSNLGTSLRLPEWNISERIAPKARASEPAPYDYSQAMSTPDRSNPTPPPYSPPPSGGGPTNQPPQRQFYNPQFQGPDQGTPDNGPSELDLINNEFNDFQNYLGQQETTARGRFDTLSSDIGAERDTAVTDATAQRGLRTAELEQKAAGGRQNERLNLQKVRQLLQDLEQKNAARTSVMGGGGSMNEALADRFGRTAQTNVGGVLQEGQRFQSDVSMQQEKVAQFYDNAVQKIKDTSTQQINVARQSLNENLGAIDAERRASAGEKARARYDAWKTYYANVNQAKLQAANFQMQYDLWNKTKSAEIAGAQNYQTGNIEGQDYSQFLDPSQYSNGGIGGGVGATAPTYAETYVKPGSKKSEDQYDQNGNLIRK